MVTKTLDIESIRREFPILHQHINGVPLVYFDNAATTQKPKAVIDAIRSYYEQANANVHRGVHHLSARATKLYEQARATIRSFINAPAVNECIFVRGTTEAINLVANSYVAPLLKAGDEILITHMEHHSNIVPWQMLCKKTGAHLKVAPIDTNGELLLDEFATLLNNNTKFVAISYASNALGTINPVRKMIDLAHARGIKVLLDGAQATAHLPVDVQHLDCDFYAFSGHKMYGPTGVGVLWGRAELLDQMPPYQGGGEMIYYVSFSETQYAPIPQKFEAGTPNISGAIGLAAAIDFLSALDMQLIAHYEQQLLEYATAAIESLPGFTIIGKAKHKVPVISFIHDKIHAHDIGTIVDTEGVALRSGHHCAMPLMDFFGVAATSRMSLSFYNTEQEIDRCIAALRRVNEVFA